MTASRYRGEELHAEGELELRRPLQISVPGLKRINIKCIHLESRIIKQLP